MGAVLDLIAAHPTEAALLLCGTLVLPKVAGALIGLLFLGTLATLKTFELIGSKVFGFGRPKMTAFLPRGSVKKVAIVGAGTSGIAAAKEALQAGFEVTVFEMTDQIGGNWVFREEECHASVYRSLFINTTKQLMTYSDYPMPLDYPTYPHHKQILKYSTDYANHFGVIPRIRFHTQVVDISMHTDGRSWDVVSRPCPKGVPWADANALKEIRDGSIDLTDAKALAAAGLKKETYDAVMVANGHHSVPAWPNPPFPGQETFEGHLMHSHSYKDPTSCGTGYNFVDKHVVVLGIGNSGVDIANELSRVSRQVYTSTRSGAWIIPKFINGKALDHILGGPRAVYHLLPTFLRRNLTLLNMQGKKIEKVIDEFQGPMAQWGFKPKGSALSMHPTVSHEILHRIGLGTVIVKPNIKRIEARHVVFEDGSRVPADAIVFGTGYDIKFPFLKDKYAPFAKSSDGKDSKESKDGGKTGHNSVEAYKFIFSPHLPATLAHVGLFQPIGALMPMSEMQARWICQIWRGERGLPSAEVMRRDIDTYRDYLLRRYLDRPRHTIQTDMVPFMEDYAEMIGCTPSIWNPRLWPVLRELLWSPAGWPLHYRLSGPGAWAGSQKALKAYFAQSDRRDMAASHDW